MKDKRQMKLKDEGEERTGHKPYMPSPRSLILGYVCALPPHTHITANAVSGMHAHLKHLPTGSHIGSRALLF